MFFYILALATILESTRWVGFFEANGADIEAASWKGTSSMRHRQHALFARLHNS